MKKIILILFLAFFSNVAEAQEIYNIVLDGAKRVVNSPASSFTQTRIAQFKVTSLTYISQKAFETKEVVTEDFLDTQAYYLSEFLTCFFEEILTNRKMEGEKKKERILLFIDATVSNPLFHDTDTATVHSYINSKGEVTPFSIDTDWQKAFHAVKENL